MKLVLKVHWLGRFLKGVIETDKGPNEIHKRVENTKGYLKLAKDQMKFTNGREKARRFLKRGLKLAKDQMKFTNGWEKARGVLKRGN